MKLSISTFYVERADDEARKYRKYPKWGIDLMPPKVVATFVALNNAVKSQIIGLFNLIFVALCTGLSV